MSAFAISPFVQSVNDVLFPIELFLMIFPILYAIFVPAQSVSLPVTNSVGVISEELPVLETHGNFTGIGAVSDREELSKPESSIIETAPLVVETGIVDEARHLVLIDVKEERKKLLNLGVGNCDSSAKNAEFKAILPSTTVKNSMDSLTF
nr:hypothetical protein [Nostoc sp. EkiNYC01]